jgi:hypothetical protein
MNRKSRVLLCCLLASALLGVPAWAQSKTGSGLTGRPNHANPECKTKEQQIRQEMRPLFEQRQADFKAGKAAVKQYGPDSPQAKTILEKIQSDDQALKAAEGKATAELQGCPSPFTAGGQGKNGGQRRRQGDQRPMGMMQRPGGMAAMPRR